MRAFQPLPKKILIIRLSSLGDIVLTTPLIRSLRKRLPNTVIDMVTRERYKPLLEMINHLDGSIGYPEGLLTGRTIWRELKQAGYDTVIDLQNNIASRLITRAVKPDHILRFRRSRINRWIRIHLPKQRRNLVVPPPVAIGYLNVAKPLWVEDDGKGLELYVDDRSTETMQKLLNDYHQRAELPSDIKPLILAPGARHKTKIGLVERWAELMNIAYEEGYKSQVLIGNFADWELLNSIQKQVDFPVLFTAGQTSFNELAAMIALGSALVSSDSGPMHIAGAVGTPVVAIFGPTVPEFGFAPFRCVSEIVQVDDDLFCRPCHPHGPNACPVKHFRCMIDISSDVVFTALKRIAINVKQTEAPLPITNAGME